MKKKHLIPLVIILAAEVLENQQRDEVATEVPLRGDLNSPTSDISATVFNVF